MAGEASGRTLQTTALVNEAYLRMVGGKQVRWANRRHFFAAAAKIMRQILVDDARRRQRLKRGGPGAGTQPRSRKGTEEKDAGGGARGRKPPALSVEEAAVFDRDPTELLALDEALTKLEQIDPRKVEVVELRHYAGLTLDECAAAMELSPRTVSNEWRIARAWLHAELS